MKSYLSLIPISAKVHRRQNSMTLLCIIISVFLVTVVFSMAEFGIRLERSILIEDGGNWHIILNNVNKEDAVKVLSDSNVAASACFIREVSKQNDSISEGSAAGDYLLNGKKVVLSGADSVFVTEIMNCLTEGEYPNNDNEIIVSSNIKTLLGFKIGDTIAIDTPSDKFNYKISGFTDYNMPVDKQSDQISILMGINSFNEINNDKNIADTLYYVQFKKYTNISNVIQQLKKQYGWTDKNIIENSALIGLTSLSSSSQMQSLYIIAVVLGILIMIAGVLMISGSINSNVAQRTKFFGMMRCIGMSKRQIVRFVRFEALNWCKTAIPSGVVLGILTTWGVCAVIKYSIGGEFSQITVLGFSFIGIGCGIIVGLVTVLLAARSPAKRAAKVSPAAAISGNTNNIKYVYHPYSVRFIKIETALGIHHALAAKKNFILMMCSFSLSIILFLSFSSGSYFVRSLLPSLKKWSPDCQVISSDYSCTIDRELAAEIESIEGVERVFGNMYASGLSVLNNKKIDKINLLSYEQYMLKFAEEDLQKGDFTKINEDGRYVFSVYDKDNPLKVGDKISVEGKEVEVAGILEEGLFSENVTLICSEETFIQLTGEKNYSMLNIHLRKNADGKDIAVIRNLTGDIYKFNDLRSVNKENNNTYLAFSVLSYSFLGIIAMITVLNIINSISMSVSANIKQYGAMRAVGMDGYQITKMIAAEVFTYSLYGCVSGCAIGLALNWLLFDKLVTAYFGENWSFPLKEMAVILLVVAAAVVAAVYIPAKRIRNMAVTETINEL